VPGFAVPFLDLFGVLSDLYRSQALGQAYGHAMKVFQDVEKGQEVNPSDLLEACRYRVALEMCRVRMNNKIRETASKVYQQILWSDYSSVFCSELNVYVFHLILLSVQISFSANYFVSLTSCSFSLQHHYHMQDLCCPRKINFII